MVRTADIACKTLVCGINEKLVYAIFVRSRLSFNNVKLYCGRNTVCGDSNSIIICEGRIEAGYLVGGNGEAHLLLAALTMYPYGKTGIAELLANKVELLEAVVVVNAVACSGVLRKLFNSIEAKLDRLGSIVIYVNGNRSIFLVGNYNGICAGNSGINRRGIDSNAVNCKRFCLAISERSVKSETGEIESIAYEVVNPTLGNKLKAVLISLLNDAGEAKLKDILSTTVLTTADYPLTFCNVKLDLNKRATGYVTNELNVINCAVGSGNGNKLHISAGGTVLNDEGKLTCTGNVYLDLGSRVTDLNRFLVLNAVIGLSSVSDLGAGNDSELAIDRICSKCAGLKRGDVKGVVDSLKVCGKALAAAVITGIVAIGIFAIGGFLITNIAQMVLILVSALRKNFLTYVANVVVIFISVSAGSCATATYIIYEVMYVFNRTVSGVPIGIADIGNLGLRECVNCRLTEVTNKVCVSVNVLTCGIF